MDVDIDELTEKLNVDRELVKQAVNANGFFEDSLYDDKQEFLIRCYVDYLIAQEDAKDSRNVFKYTDGEEGVDKSMVYDQNRRYAMDLLTVWRNAKRDYDDERSGKSSFFKLRKRAGFINGRSR